MKNAIVALAAVLALSGCVSTKNVKADMAALQGASYRSVAVASREKPDFGAMTAGKATFGLIGGVAMIAAGNRIVRDNEVEDPAVYISAELSRKLAEKLALESHAAAGKTAHSDDVGALAALYANDADLLLDVRTINWSFVYFPTDWNSYRVIYSAKLRLIDTHSKKVVAEGFCARVPEKSADAPSHDQLLADRAARLKQELRIAADECIAHMNTQVLGV